MLIGSRAIQGIGAALMMPATLSIITHTFPAAERGRAIGIWAGVSALALSIGPVVGGALTEYVSWRAIFFINLAWSLAAGKKAPDNPWGEGATTLEWTLSSPPPFHQFETLPKID